MKEHLSLLAVSAGLFLASINAAYAVSIDFNTDQGGTPYVGLGDSFVANEYNGVIINDSDPVPGSTFVNETNPLNVGTDINGYYVNVGAFDNVQTQLTLDFTTPVTEVSFDFANPQGFLTITAFDVGGASLGNFVFLGNDIFINQAGANQGAGHVDIMGIGNIAALVIEPNFNEALILDNLNFSPVPIPAALPLFAAGLLGLSFIGRRKQS